jgi:hypothetical protein
MYYYIFLLFFGGYIFYFVDLILRMDDSEWVPCPGLFLRGEEKGWMVS